VSPEALGALVFCLALGLLFAGMPVAFALFAANLVGAWFLLGDLPGLLQLVDNATAQVTSFTLVAVPLFVLMGSLMFHSGLALRVFDALDALIGRLPGRLCYLTVAGSTAFSTLTGSSLANTAMLGALMVPEMERRGYARHMAIGPVVGTGGLAMLIPPSSLGVLLGSLAGINIGALLIAGLLPGLLLAVLYAGVVWLQVRRDPSVAPAYDVPARPRGERLRLVARILLPLGLVLFSVVGLLVLGIATPSEAAAFGVLSVAGIAAAGRRLTRAVLARALTDTASVSGMVFVLIMAAAVFSQLLAFSGASRVAVEWALSLGQDPLALLLLMFAVLLVLGMFIDQISIMLLTIPIFMPLVKALGLDPVWFGLLMLLALEMSLTTPPFGLLLFLMQGVAPAGTTFGDVTRAAVPYLACNFIAAALIIAFPGIALWLPELWLR
jgi:tripartite ATP-independent transporter DctM subunit